MTNSLDDAAAPMAAAPLLYREDGAVDWGQMWTSFCALAVEGGPPHRSAASSIPPQTAADPQHPRYAWAAAEICRGIAEASGLPASPAAPGWIGVECADPGQAGWMAAAIEEEQVAARASGATLLVPVAETFELKGEIKSVITVVAKTSHYWTEHLPPTVKQSLATQARLAGLGERIARLWRGKRNA
jgi:sirohydrochlorin cobaltochelatase